jgi:RHS repeat-associated protein
MCHGQPFSLVANNYLYRGEQYNSDLGFYYLRARYYNPQTGRFLSRDPESGKPYIPATLHKYLYAGGDPVDRIDPRGQLFENALLDDIILPEIQERLTKKLVKILVCTSLELVVFYNVPIGFDFPDFGRLCNYFLDI